MLAPRFAEEMLFGYALDYRNKVDRLENIIAVYLGDLAPLVFKRS